MNKKLNIGGSVIAVAIVAIVVIAVIVVSLRKRTPLSFVTPPSVIIGGVQTTPFNVYDAGHCACGDCTSFTSLSDCDIEPVSGFPDWSIGLHGCCFTCPAQRTCSRLNTSICSNVPNSSKGLSPYVSAGWADNLQSGDVKCTYNLDNIDTMDQLNALPFDGKNNPSVAYAFCNRTATTCEIDPKTSQPMSSCSRVKSTGLDGDYCRGWFNNLQEQDKDTYIQNYCTNHNTPDCGCFNRAQDTVYSAVKQAYPFNDACWYIDCANPQVYLRTSDLNTNNCPTNVCEVLNEYINDHDIHVDKNQTSINCVFTPKPPPPPPPCTSTSDCTGGQVCVNKQCVPPPPPSSCTSTSDCTTGQVCVNGKCVTKFSKFSKFLEYIKQHIVFAIVLLLLFVIFVVVFVIIRSRKANPNL